MCFESCRRKRTAGTFIEKYLVRNFALHLTSYLSIAASKILPHSKKVKNTKKLSVFGKNNSRCLSIFLETLIFGHIVISGNISRTYNQINYRNIWQFLSVLHRCFFFGFFSKKTRALMPLRTKILLLRTRNPRLSGVFFFTLFHDPCEACQNRFSCGCVKLLEKVLYCRSWKNSFLQEGTWLQQQVKMC